MVTRLYLATGDALAITYPRSGRWRVELQLVDLPTQCVAVDPRRPEYVYCGTFGQGLWRSRDAGSSWESAGPGIAHAQVMSVAVSSLEHNGRTGVVWAGTEPSALFRSEDGGATWVERPSLRDLPSASTWSFPPRPWTHHVRWIAPDPVVPQRLFVGIELGGVMRSLDGGETWEDRKRGGQPDAHTLGTHPQAPGRVYEAAGGGYAESLDGGATWHRYDAGLRHSYLWGLAIDPGNPETVIVSAATGPRQAHDRSAAWATVYRRTGQGPWQEVRTGLREPKGTRVYELGANPAEPGVFYAATRDGELFRSPDAGLSWEYQDVMWPSQYQNRELHGLAIVGVD